MFKRIVDLVYFWTHRWAAPDLILDRDMVCPRRMVVRSLLSNGYTFTVPAKATVWVRDNLIGIGIDRPKGHGLVLKAGGAIRGWGIAGHLNCTVIGCSTGYDAAQVENIPAQAYRTCPPGFYDVQRKYGYGVTMLYRNGNTLLEGNGEIPCT